MSSDHDGVSGHQSECILDFHAPARYVADEDALHSIVRICAMDRCDDVGQSYFGGTNDAETATSRERATRDLARCQ